MLLVMKYTARIIRPQITHLTSLSRVIFSSNISILVCLFTKRGRETEIIRLIILSGSGKLKQIAASSNLFQLPPGS